MTCLIPLTQGKFATVDDCDYDRVMRWKWFAVYVNGKWYAARKVTVDGRQCTVFMHRFLLGAEGKTLGDHKDGNGLNNTRENLRPATRAQNMANSGRLARNTSGYRGVTWCKRLGKWRAAIGVNYGKLSLGTHASITDAARAYDAKAIELFGDFARLNFPAG